MNTFITQSRKKNNGALRTSINALKINISRRNIRKDNPPNIDTGYLGKQR